MTFADPKWLFLLLLLPILAGVKVLSRRRGSQGVDRFVARRLQPGLVRRTPAGNDWTVFGLQMAALVCLILAMARPQAGFRVVETVSSGRNLLIALDTSRSMLSEDVLPNRMDRAKLAATDMVHSLPTDRIGLIAFAGESFLQAPLTVDHDAVLETVVQLDTEVIPRGGTNLVKAVTLALDALSEARTEDGALVIFSDGEDLEGGEDLTPLMERIQEQGLVIVTVGVGTETGGIIPDPTSDEDGVFVKDEGGEIVRTRLNSTMLQNLASASGGVYLNLGGNNSVTDVVRTVLSGLDRKREEADQARVPIERFPLPLSVGLILLAIAHLVPLHPRLSTQGGGVRAATTVVLGIICLLPVLSLAQDASESSVPTEELKTVEELDDESAVEAYRQENYSLAMDRYKRQVESAESATDKAEGNLGLGASAFRKGDLEAARQAFGEMLKSPARKDQERAHFNLGSTLYDVGTVFLEQAVQEAGSQGVPQGALPVPASGGEEHPLSQLQISDEAREAVLQQWRSSSEHFGSSLKLNPRSGRARRNLEFVNQQIERLETKPPEDENQDQEDDENQEDDEQDDQNQDDNQDQNQNNQNQDQNSQQNPNQDQNEQESQGNPDQQDSQQNPQQPPPQGEQEQQPQGGDESEQQPQEDGEQPSPPPGQPQSQQVSPSMARQILEQHSDEDPNARIQPLVPYEDESYKNW